MICITTNYLTPPILWRYLYHFVKQNVITSKSKLLSERLILKFNDFKYYPMYYTLKCLLSSETCFKLELIFFLKRFLSKNTQQHSLIHKILLQIWALRQGKDKNQNYYHSQSQNSFASLYKIAYFLLRLMDCQWDLGND